jgi:phage tail-like protein
MTLKTNPDNSTTTRARTDSQSDALPGFAFHVEITGVVEAVFTAVSGLNVSREAEQIREGGVNDATHWAPGRYNFGKVTLERGIAHSDSLWSWFNSGATDGKVTLKTVTVRQYVPYTSKVAREYILTDCMPLSWTGPGFNAGSNDISIEKLELGFKRFDLVNK